MHPRSLDAGAHVLTVEGAAVLSGAGVEAAGGDLVLRAYDVTGQPAGWVVWSSSRSAPVVVSAGPELRPAVYLSAPAHAVLRGGVRAEGVRALVVVVDPLDALVLAAALSDEGVSGVGVVGLCGAGDGWAELGARVGQWAWGGEGRAVVVAADRGAAGVAQVVASVSAEGVRARVLEVVEARERGCVWRGVGQLWAWLHEGEGGAVEEAPVWGEAGEAPARLVITDAGAVERARALTAGLPCAVLAVGSWLPEHGDWLRRWAGAGSRRMVSVCATREAIAQAVRASLPLEVQVWRGRVVSAAEAKDERGDAALVALLQGPPVEAAAVEVVEAASWSSTRPAQAQRARPVVEGGAVVEVEAVEGEAVEGKAVAEVVEGAKGDDRARAALRLDGRGGEVATDDDDVTDDTTDAELEAAAGGHGWGEVAGAVVELSLGCGVAVRDDDASAKRGAFVPLTRNGREVVRGLNRVRPLRLTFGALVDLLRSHTSARYRHKPGPFIVGAVFGGSDKHPSGHRCGDTLRRVTMLCLDVDGAADLTPLDLEQRLEALGVAAVGYTTWSHGRGTKQGLCARVLLPLSRPLDAPADLQGRARVQWIGRQLAALVGYVGARLGVPVEGKALDGVSSQPEQLMYTPRHGAAWFYPSEGQRAQALARPFLNPDALPCGVALADLVGAVPVQPSLTRQDTTRHDKTRQDTTGHDNAQAVASTSEPPPAASTREGDDADKGLRWLTEWAARQGVELGTLTPTKDGGWKLRPPRCPSASGCADGAAFFVNADGSLGFKCYHHTCTIGSRGWQALRAEVEGRRAAGPSSTRPERAYTAARYACAALATTGHTARAQDEADGAAAAVVAAEVVEVAAVAAVVGAAAEVIEGGAVEGLSPEPAVQLRRVSLPAYEGQPAVEAAEGAAQPCPPLTPTEEVEGREAARAVVEGAEYDLRPLPDGSGWHFCARYQPTNLLTEQLGEVWRSLTLKAAQGTGKTKALGPLVEQTKAKGQRVLILTHRRSLARDLSKRLRARCYLDARGGRLKVEPGQALVLSLDSIGRLDTCDLDLVIIDESEQVARHLFGRTVGDKLGYVAAVLYSALRYAGRVVCADADAGRLTHRLLVECAERTSGLLHVVNTWRGWGFNLNGSRRVLTLNDHSHAGRMMLHDAVLRAVGELEEGEHIAVACTSSAQAQVIAQILFDHGLGEGVLLVTSKTRGVAKVKTFLEDPNANLPRVLIYSPTLGTGCSIDREVKRVFVCGAAVEGLTGPDVVQLMTRCRTQAIPPLLWLENKTYDEMPHTFEDAKAQVERRLDAIAANTARTLGDGYWMCSRWRERVFYNGHKGRGEDAKTFGLFVDVVAETGRTGWNNVKCVLEALAERGAEVHMVSGNTGAVHDMREANKEARESIEAEAIAAVVEADPLPSGADLDALRQEGTPEERAAVMRHDIEARGLEVTPQTARAAVAHDAPRTGRKLAEVAAHAQGGEAAQYLARSTLQTFKTCTPLAYRETNGAYAALLKGALEAVGLEGVLSEGAAALGEGWAFDLNKAAPLNKLCAYLEAKRDDFKALGVSVPEPKPEKPAKPKAPKPKTEKQAKAEAKAKAKAKAEAKAKAGAKVKPWRVREWLTLQLERLGILIDRPSKELSGAARERGAVKAYTLTRAAVVVAWQWAARPFANIVEAAELDAAEWAAAGVG